MLGVKIPAGGGISDGEKVLDIVARHPSTARFISKKLAMRFVADEPPASLVDRMAETFRKTDGDLRAVMKTMLESKEFFSEGAYRTKLKSPLEVVASAVRARQRRSGLRLSAGQPGRPVGPAALSQTGAHRLFQLQPGVAQFRRPAGAHEFRPATGR